MHPTLGGGSSLRRATIIPPLRGSMLTCESTLGVGSGLRREFYSRA